MKASKYVTVRRTYANAGTDITYSDNEHLLLPAKAS
jgi:hypothetical protein